MKFRNIVVLIAAIITLLPGIFTNPVLAQSSSEPSALKNVTLFVYPEYDDPRLLVMLEGKISDTNPPMQVRFLVPSAAEMYSAGSKDAQGQYSGGPPNRKASQIQGWDEISYTLKTDTFRVEYYDPIISSQPDKKFSYDFRSLYPITDLKVAVQVPKKASDFTVSPTGNKTVEGDFTVYTYNYTNPNITQPLHFDIAYTKSDLNPSLQVPGSAPVTSNPQNLTPIIIFLGVALVMGVFLWRMKARKKTGSNKAYSARYRQSRTIVTKSLKNNFCNHCGQPLGIPAKFCPQCGNKLES